MYRHRPGIITMSWMMQQRLRTGRGSLDKTVQVTVLCIQMLHEWGHALLLTAHCVPPWTCLFNDPWTLTYLLRAGTLPVFTSPHPAQGFHEHLQVMSSKEWETQIPVPEPRASMWP